MKLIVLRNGKCAFIGIENRIKLGRFSDKLEIIKARQKAKSIYHG